jgi:hypothetical protein
MQLKLRNRLKSLIHRDYIQLVRGYAFIVFEYLSGYHFAKKRFLHKHGYPLDLENPKSINQKIFWKKIYDRDPLLVRTSDKYEVRSYVRERLGDAVADEILVPLLYVGKDPSEIPFDSLPPNYIVKVTHDSGGYQIVKGGDVDRKALVERMKDRLRNNYGMFKHEWAYHHIKERRIIIEELLQDESGNAQDYKFHMFNGKCGFIHATPKLGEARTGVRSLFTPEWKLLPAGWKYEPGPFFPAPTCLERMMQLSEKLSAEFQYVRVDLYEISGRIYFGELTHYHGSGMEKFYPSSFDFEAGAMWGMSKV